MKNIHLKLVNYYILVSGILINESHFYLHVFKLNTWLNKNAFFRLN